MAEARITGPNGTDEAYTQWLYDGLSVPDAARKSGIGPSTFQDKIRRERSKNPDLDDLRELQNTLRSSNASVADALRYANWKDRLDDQNISTPDLEKVVPIIEKLGDNPLQRVRAAERLALLEKKTGKGPDQVLQEHSSKSQELVTLEQNVKKLRHEETDLLTSLKNLQELESIQGTMKSNSIQMPELGRFISRHRKLESLGFAEGVAELIGTELAKINQDLKVAVGIFSAELSRREELSEEIGTLVSRRDALDSQLQPLEREKDDLASQIKWLNENRKKASEDSARESRELGGRIESLKSQKDNLETMIDEMQDEVSLGHSAIVLLQNPRSVTDAELDDLIRSLTDVKESRRRGYGFQAEKDLRGAIDLFLKRLASVPGLQIVLRSEYDRLQEENNEIRNSASYTRQAESQSKVLQQEKTIKAMKDATEDIGTFLFGEKKFRPIMIGYECDTHGDIGLTRRDPSLLKGLVEQGYYEITCAASQRSGRPHKIRLTFERLYEYALRSHIS